MGKARQQAPPTRHFAGTPLFLSTNKLFMQVPTRATPDLVLVRRGQTLMHSSSCQQVNFCRWPAVVEERRERAQCAQSKPILTNSDTNKRARRPTTHVPSLGELAPASRARCNHLNQQRVGGSFPTPHQQPPQTSNEFACIFRPALLSLL